MADNGQMELVWIYNGRLSGMLDSATWLETGRELQNLGWKVTFITRDEQEAAAAIPDLTIQSMTPPEIYALGQLLFHLQAARFIVRRHARADVVLFHHQSALWLLPLLIWARLSGRRAPHMVMDTRTVPMTVQGVKARMRARYEWAMYGFGKRWAHGNTAITERMAEEIGITGRKLWGVWPSGVKPEQFAPARFQRVWPSENEVVRVIYIGTLYPERNLMTTCEAVLAANQAGMPIVLTIVGSGPQWQELAEFAATSNGAIEVLSAVPHTEMPNLLAKAHVGILPFPDDPIFRVSSPIKLFEYMASGMPVLATRIVCHTDVLGDAPFAFWIDGSHQAAITAAFAELAANRQQLPELGGLAADYATGWSWQSAAKKLDSALTRDLPRGRRAKSKPAHPREASVELSL